MVHFIVSDEDIKQVKCHRKVVWGQSVSDIRVFSDIRGTSIHLLTDDFAINLADATINGLMVGLGIKVGFTLYKQHYTTVRFDQAF